MLGNRQRDAGDIDFLEAVASDEVARHVAGNGDHRYGVKHSGSNAGHKIGRARAAGGDDHTDLSGGS